MPHDLLHAHPFYDDRPLLDDARLPLTALTSRGEINSGKHVTKAKTSRFLSGEEAELRQSCNLIFTLCYSAAASLQQSSFNYMCTKFKVGRLRCFPRTKQHLVAQLEPHKASAHSFVFAVAVLLTAAAAC